MTKLSEELERIAARVAEARAAGDEYQSKRALKIAELGRPDEFGETLNAQARASRLTAFEEEHRLTAREQAREHREMALTLKANLENTIAGIEARHRPTGTDAVTAAMHRDRVRSLLESGMQPVAIIDRAAATNDRETLDALRDELVWMTSVSVDSFEAAIERWAGVEAADPVAAVHGLRRHLDATALPLLPDELAEARRAQLDLEDQWPGHEVWLKGVLDVDHPGGLATAIEARYAGRTTAVDEPSDAGADESVGSAA